MRDWTISGPKCCGLAGCNTAFAAEGGKKIPIFISDLSSVTEQLSVCLKVQGLEVNFGIIFSPDTWRWLTHGIAENS